MSYAIKLSCTDFTFGLLAHEDALAVIRMLGLVGVDIGVFGADTHTRPRDVTADVARAARQLRTKLKRVGLALADVFIIPGTEWSLAPNHPDGRVRRRCRDLFDRMIEYTVQSGGRHLTGLPGMVFPQAGRGDSFKRSIEEMAW